MGLTTRRYHEPPGPARHHDVGHYYGEQIYGGEKTEGMVHVLCRKADLKR